MVVVVVGANLSFFFPPPWSQRNFSPSPEFITSSSRRPFYFSSAANCRTPIFLLIAPFYGSFQPGLYGLGYIKSSACIALALTANIYLYVPSHVSADLLSLAVSAVGVVVVVRLEPTKPCVKSMRSRKPEGFGSFSERRNWLQLSGGFFFFHCFSAPSSDANSLMIPKNASNLPQLDLTMLYTYVVRISNDGRSAWASYIVL